MRLTSTAALMVTACALGLPPGLAATRAQPTRRTEVIIFQPSLPSRTKAAQGGRCWTESITVTRHGAWRCIHVNMIYDPCFEVAGVTNPAGLLRIVRHAVSGKVWTADKVCFSVAPSEGGPPFKLLKREAGIVHRLWE